MFGKGGKKLQKFDYQEQQGLFRWNKKHFYSFWRPIIWRKNKNLRKKIADTSFKDNIWGVYLVDMQLLSTFNKGIKYLLCAIDLFSKYAWVVLLKKKQISSVINAFQNVLDSSKRKPNKAWVDQGSEFHNNAFKKFWKKMTLKCIQLLIKENLFFKENLIFKLFQKMFVLMC